jgi:hypothetical protein
MANLTERASQHALSIDAESSIEAPFVIVTNEERNERGKNRCQVALAKKIKNIEMSVDEITRNTKHCRNKFDRSNTYSEAGRISLRAGGLRSVCSAVCENTSPLLGVREAVGGSNVIGLPSVVRSGVSGIVDALTVGESAEIVVAGAADVDVVAVGESVVELCTGVWIVSDDDVAVEKVL